MASDFALEAQQLTKVFRTFWRRREFRAVDNISIQVPRGTTFGFLGPNGAGKTTFVKMLLASVHPSSGITRIFGQDSREPEARRPVGYLPENHRFPTYFTGAGMLHFYGALSGMDLDTRNRRIAELLEQLGLKEWGEVRIGKYSKGMLQRLGLAQALIHSPQLLILDEPSDGVDPVGRRHIRDILHSLEQKGVTIFINSHLLIEVELFCRDVAILHKGKIALTGSVRELTAGKGYRLATPADLPERLRNILQATASSATSRDGMVEFHFATREQTNQAIDLLRNEKLQVESVIPTSSTLEDVFIKTVEA
ncbi:MAG TPA: ABC transporter ATP-binding protein [Bryobacteraceae bacterium]|nr:ABC transporter ATP-binding protein [Bryobacteraceae bacterium]